MTEPLNHPAQQPKLRLSDLSLEHRYMLFTTLGAELAITIRLAVDDFCDEARLDLPLEEKIDEADIEEVRRMATYCGIAMAGTLMRSSSGLVDVNLLSLCNARMADAVTETAMNLIAGDGTASDTQLLTALRRQYDEWLEKQLAQARVNPEAN